MNHRSRTPASLVIACLALGACSGGDPGDSPEPELLPDNFPIGQAEQQADVIILISLDTLRADHLSVYGYDRPTSPAKI